ncbi:MAG TPA: phosphoribosylformylglycinamidine synthase subunit PurL [Candidatus Kapabacteria bacterium]|nr:phosphoribosylformylglycinamidine synthase subunit PurL [Candidatus Kapabacteria bacterium]
MNNRAVANEPAVNKELAEQLGLTGEEYEKILSILGRTPTYTELGIYGAMWSEHTSYKNSIETIKEFLPRKGGRMLVEAGEENAGLIDIGGDYALAFKIESHNHPSAVEPYQGAATGVGGIQRDIFTMGARPIASLDSLRFGDLNNAHVRYLLNGVVRGIGDYGNSFGVPTVGGEIYFDDSYTGNPLVNAMSIGIVHKKKTASAEAKGVGNIVMIVGSRTGRDGIHGASLLASREFDEQTEHMRPTVQVGDPFTEKLLLEATLEIINEGLVVGIQDMGAAGISCSTMEMSAKGGVGMDIDLDKVPLREENMSAYEIMLSESQERMLVVVEKEKVARIKTIFEKWDLPAVEIGTITGDGLVRLHRYSKEVACVPAGSLSLGSGAPVYHRESKKPKYLSEIKPVDQKYYSEKVDPKNVLLRLLGSPNIASKKWVYNQYDSMVRSNSMVLWNGDAAVIRIKELPGTGIAAKTDCNARYAYLNPYRGGMIAVVEAARNVVCVGGEPAAITNCLNFGNPYDPEIFYQFREAVRGVGDACRALNTPVTGGNVSFYNENPSGAIYPTPVIGMVGIVDLKYFTTANFKNDGDVIVLLGKLTYELGGSEYLKVLHNIVAGDAPALDTEFEKHVQKACLHLIRSGKVRSAHDISEGGLLTAIAESCIADPERQKGAELSLHPEILTSAGLFGESQSCIIVSVASVDIADVQKAAEKNCIPATVLGKVGGVGLCINNNIEISLDEMNSVYYGALEHVMTESENI